jgi:hypothetical protein
MTTPEESPSIVEMQQDAARNYLYAANLGLEDASQVQRNLLVLLSLMLTTQEEPRHMASWAAHADVAMIACLHERPDLTETFQDVTFSKRDPLELRDQTIASYNSIVPSGVYTGRQILEGLRNATLEIRPTLH